MIRTILVTGAAGFIGHHVCQRLLEGGERVLGIDNLNDYYDPGLKRARLSRLATQPGFCFEQIDLADRPAMAALFAATSFDAVINLAAQAGVRYSLDNPAAYIDSNLSGFGNVLEGCRQNGVPQLLFASSSSVYGANTRMPFSTHDNVDHPVSLYAASKKANELMAHSYSHLYGLACTGLRFFTVYGPWGRPDMAYFSFTRKILAGEPIPVFNHGRMERDFTYIDDVVEGVVRLLDKPAAPNPHWRGDAPDPASSYAPYRLYNIGNHQPVPLMRFIEMLQDALGKEAIIDFQPFQAGDVQATYAEIDDLAADVGFRPRTPLREGLAHFVAWYRDYYRV